MESKEDLENKDQTLRGFQELLRMNPTSLSSSSTTEDLEICLEKLKKLFEVMHLVNIEGLS